MKKGFTERVFILDRSGSMAGLEGDTLGGFNAMIERQKQLPGKACVSAVLFDHESVVLHDRVDIQKVRPMTGEDYAVRGCTALLDAAGQATGFCPGNGRPLPFCAGLWYNQISAVC